MDYSHMSTAEKRQLCHQVINFLEKELTDCSKEYLAEVNSFLIYGDQMYAEEHPINHAIHHFFNALRAMLFPFRAVGNAWASSMFDIDREFLDVNTRTAKRIAPDGVREDLCMTIQWDSPMRCTNRVLLQSATTLNRLRNAIDASDKQCEALFSCFVNIAEKEMNFWHAFYPAIEKMDINIPYSREERIKMLKDRPVYYRSSFNRNIDCILRGKPPIHSRK